MRLAERYACIASRHVSLYAVQYEPRTDSGVDSCSAERGVLDAASVAEVCALEAPCGDVAASGAHSEPLVVRVDGVGGSCVDDWDWQ